MLELANWKMSQNLYFQCIIRVVCLSSFRGYNLSIEGCIIWCSNDIEYIWSQIDTFLLSCVRKESQEGDAVGIIQPMFSNVILRVVLLNSILRFCTLQDRKKCYLYVDIQNKAVWKYVMLNEPKSSISSKQLTTFNMLVDTSSVGLDFVWKYYWLEVVEGHVLVLSK